MQWKWIMITSEKNENEKFNRNPMGIWIHIYRIECRTKTTTAWTQTTWILKITLNNNRIFINDIIFLFLSLSLCTRCMNLNQTRLFRKKHNQKLSSFSIIDTKKKEKMFFLSIHCSFFRVSFDAITWCNNNDDIMVIIINDGPYGPGPPYSPKRNRRKIYKSGTNNTIELWM